MKLDGPPINLLTINDDPPTPVLMTHDGATIHPTHEHLLPYCYPKLDTHPANKERVME